MEQNNRLARYSGRAALRTITSVTACYDCGRESVMPGGTVAVRATAGLGQDGLTVAGYAGTATCGRIWLCPVCNAKVMARRAFDLGHTLTWAHQNGYLAVFGSLTVRHNLRSDLRQMIDLQQAAWRKVVSTKGWKGKNATRTIDHAHAASCEAGCERKRDVIDTGKDGRIGYVRAAELNFGQVNGWHPHFHPIILVRGPRELAQRIAEQTVAAWVDAVNDLGGDAMGNDAQQLRVIDAVNIHDELGSYVTKATYDPARLALEAVWSQNKTGRGRVKETVSHWTILAEVEMGLADGAFRWMELEKATKGHRMITWSRGLRDFCGLNDEKSDEEIAAEEVGSKDDTVCIITANGWRTVRDSPEMLALMLDTLEQSGWAALRLVLDNFGIEWAQMGDLADASDYVNRQYAADRRMDEQDQYNAEQVPF